LWSLPRNDLKVVGIAKFGHWPNKFCYFSITNKTPTVSQFYAPVILVLFVDTCCITDVILYVGVMRPPEISTRQWLPQKQQ